MYKCKVMHMGRNNQSHDYVMEANNLQVKLAVTKCEKTLE